MRAPTIRERWRAEKFTEPEVAGHCARANATVLATRSRSAKCSRGGGCTGVFRLPYQAGRNYSALSSLVILTAIDEALGRTNEVTTSLAVRSSVPVTASQQYSP